MDYRVFIVRTDVNACNCAWACTDIESVCTESWLWEENPLPHRGIEPVPAARQSDAETELHPHLHLVNWCFEPSQPLRIISGLKETFIKWYVVERTKKAEIRLEEQSQKTESCRENVWNEIQLKRITKTVDTRTEWKEVGKLGWFMSDINRNIPTTWRWTRGNTRLYKSTPL